MFSTQHLQNKDPDYNKKSMSDAKNRDKVFQDTRSSLHTLRLQIDQPQFSQENLDNNVEIIIRETLSANKDMDIRLLPDILSSLYDEFKIKANNQNNEVFIESINKACANYALNFIEAKINQTTNPIHTAAIELNDNLQSGKEILKIINWAQLCSKKNNLTSNDILNLLRNKIMSKCCAVWGTDKHKSLTAVVHGIDEYCVKVAVNDIESLISPSEEKIKVIIDRLLQRWPVGQYNYETTRTLSLDYLRAAILASNKIKPEDADKAIDIIDKQLDGVLDCLRERNAIQPNQKDYWAKKQLEIKNLGYKETEAMQLQKNGNEEKLKELIKKDPSKEYEAKLNSVISILDVDSHTMDTGYLPIGSLDTLLVYFDGYLNTDNGKKLVGINEVRSEFASEYRGYDPSYATDINTKLNQGKSVRILGGYIGHYFGYILEKKDTQYLLHWQDRGKTLFNNQQTNDPETIGTFKLNIEHEGIDSLVKLIDKMNNSSFEDAIRLYEESIKTPGALLEKIDTDPEFKAKNMKAGICHFGSQKTTLRMLLHKKYGSVEGELIYKEFTLYMRKKLIEELENNTKFYNYCKRQLGNPFIEKLSEVSNKVTRQELSTLGDYETGENDENPNRPKVPEAAKFFKLE